MRSSTLAVALLACGTLCLGVTPSATAFELHRHSVMTYQVLTRHGIGGVAASLIAWGAMLPDVQDCIPHCYCDYAPAFCQPDSQQAIPYAVDHFDNNLLDESIFRVNDRMAEARAGMVETPTDAHASAMALVAFGKALHTTQDFYAHSTFLEINVFPLAFQFDLANAPLWYGQPYALYSWHHGSLAGDGSLQTGYYLQAPPGGGYTHDQLNKDSPGSSEGGQPLAVLGHGTTTLYGAVSGDLTGSMNFQDVGLAPQHTLYAYQQLLAGGDVFPYVFGAGKAARAIDPRTAERVLSFFTWVEQDSTMRGLSVAADSIMAHASADSLGSFPLGSVDADGLPIPATAAVGPGGPLTSGLIGTARPNPFVTRTELSYLAPRSGHVRVAVFDSEGRRIATLFSGAVEPGLHRVTWDGHLAIGAAAPPGVYLIRVTGLGADAARRVVRMR